MEIGFLLGSLLKIALLLGYLYGLLWVMGHPKLWVKALGVLAAFAVIQVALTDFNGFKLLNAFDQGLLFQAATMTMVALGLNLIYGFNGQFSLGQWGFYGIGAYCAADITYRWINGDARGLLVVGIGVILGGLVIWGIGAFLKRYRGIPVLSSFTFYILGVVAAGFLAVKLGALLNPLFVPLLLQTRVPLLLALHCRLYFSLQCYLPGRSPPRSASCLVCRCFLLAAITLA